MEQSELSNLIKENQKAMDAILEKIAALEKRLYATMIMSTDQVSFTHDASSLQQQSMPEQPLTVRSQAESEARL